MAQERHFDNGVFTSERLPPLRMEVDPAFTYVGNITFELKSIALVDRHVFVDATDGRINRMIVLQFEGFLDDNDHTYVWEITNPIVLGGKAYKHNLYLFDVSEAIAGDPGAETDHTAAFLEREGYQLENEQMMSRFARIVDAARRHELIIFYHENVLDTGHTLTEISKDGDLLPEYAALGEALTKRSLSSFSVIEE